MATQDVWQSMSSRAGSAAAQKAALGGLWAAGAANESPSGAAEGLSEASQFLKRCFDLLFSVTALLLLAPILTVISIAIRLDTPGPVLYVSERIGRHGRSFRCFKFRTMVREAERLQKRMQHLNERDAVLFKIADDPRITRVGRVLRRYSLDELPQFFNVVRGEMSVVGPRPPIASEVREYGEGHLRRLTVLPGITGLWQTQARHDPSFESYVSLDLAYIEHWCVGLDFKIILQTIFVLSSGTGI